MSQALQHAESSVIAAELAVAERNTMSTHVQDLQRLAEQLQKKVTENDLKHEQQVNAQVDKIRLALDAEQAELRAQLLVAQEKRTALEDEVTRISRERNDLNVKLNKLLENEKVEREARLREEKSFRETTIQEVMDKKKELLEERIRREAAEKRVREVVEEHKRQQQKTIDAEVAFEQLKDETKRIQLSMAELKKESDLLAEERLKVEQELRKKQEEDNEDLRREIERLLKKIALLEDIHNKVECEFRKRIAKVHRKALEYKKTIEVLEDRMKKQSGVISSA